MASSFKAKNNSPTPLISVVITTYNRVKLLSRALDSVLAQDYKNLEVIVADNASTDGTNELMLEYQKKDDRIIYIRNETNVGAEKNGLIAYRKATGKYYIILCDDDYFISPHFFSKAVEVMEGDESISLVRGICRVYDEGEKKYRIQGPQGASLVTNGLDFFKHYGMKEGYEHITGFFAMTRKSILDETQCLAWEQPGHDRWMYLCAFLYGDVYSWMDEIIGHYDEHQQGETFRMDWHNRLHTLTEAHDKIGKIGKSRHPQDVSSIDFALNEMLWKMLRFQLSVLKKRKGVVKSLLLFSPQFKILFPLFIKRVFVLFNKISYNNHR